MDRRYRGYRGYRRIEAIEDIEAIDGIALRGGVDGIEKGHPRWWRVTFFWGIALGGAMWAGDYLMNLVVAVPVAVRAVTT